MRSFFYRGRFIFIPFAIVAFVGLVGFIVMGLWNALIPAIFHAGAITFWQAVGLFVLCKILFGFGKGGPWQNRRHSWNERFKNMTPEEKQQFKDRWAHCHDWNKRNMDEKAAGLSPEPQ